MTFGMRFSPHSEIGNQRRRTYRDLRYGKHRIFGVAQAQSVDQTLTFTSQDGWCGLQICGRLKRSKGLVEAATSLNSGIHFMKMDGPI